MPVRQTIFVELGCEKANKTEKTNKGAVHIKTPVDFRHDVRRRTEQE